MTSQAALFLGAAVVEPEATGAQLAAPEAVEAFALLLVAAALVFSCCEREEAFLFKEVFAVKVALVAVIVLLLVLVAVATVGGGGGGLFAPVPLVAFGAAAEEGFEEDPLPPVTVTLVLLEA